MQYSQTISLLCSHCKKQCQLVKHWEISICEADGLFHISYHCTFCNWLILTKWDYWVSQNDIKYFTETYRHTTRLLSYFPVVGSWQPKVNLNHIINQQVKKDFQEAISCYNNGLYNATMVIARRAIHQEMIEKWLEAKYPNNLFKQIENSGIGSNLQKLLQKVKNFWNSWAHPDFCLYGNDGEKIDDEAGFAKLSLDFLDRYFADIYEIDHLVENAPKSEKELTK